MLRRHLARAVWIGLALGLALAGPVRHAPADPLPVKSGKVVLPLTGLAVDLPADKRKNATWMLSGSWSLTDGGAAFDGRDVVDLKVGDKLVAGNWVHIGYFNAGDCAAVVKALDVPDRWTGEKTLWGLKFQVAGGTWDFENNLGKKPAIALCVANAAGGSLLLYHFFLEDKAPVGKAGLAPLARDKFLERVAKAWKSMLGTWEFSQKTPDGGTFRGRSVITSLFGGRVIFATGFLGNENAMGQHSHFTAGIDPESGEWMVWNFDQDGSFTKGPAYFDGNNLVVDWKTANAADGKVIDYRVEYVFHDNGEYTVKVLTPAEKNGTRGTIAEVRYKKVGDQVPAAAETAAK